MRLPFFVIVAVITLCSFGVQREKTVKLRDKDFTYYEYKVSNGYAGSSVTYTIYVEEGVVKARYTECNYMMMQDDTDPCVEQAVSDVPQKKLREIGKLLVDVQSWESYYVEPDVFDGDNWSVNVKFGDCSFYSSGYMKWPDKAPFRSINRIIKEICNQK